MDVFVYPYNKFTDFISKFIVINYETNVLLLQKLYCTPEIFTVLSYNERASANHIAKLQTVNSDGLEYNSCRILRSITEVILQHLGMGVL